MKGYTQSQYHSKQHPKIQPPPYSSQHSTKPPPGPSTKKNKTTTKTAPKDSSAPPSTPPQNNTQGPTVALAFKRPNFKDPTVTPSALQQPQQRPPNTAVNRGTGPDFLFPKLQARSGKWHAAHACLQMDTDNGLQHKHLLYQAKSLSTHYLIILIQ